MGLFSSIVSALPAIAGIGSGIAGAFSGPPEVPKEVREQAKLTNQIMRALSNPDDPMYRRLVEQSRAGIQSDLARAINDALVANSRQVARTGGLGFIDPARRDETAAYALTRGFAQAGIQAEDVARSNLQAAMGAAPTAMAAQQPIQAYNEAQSQHQGNVLQSIFQGLNALGGMNRGNLLRPGQTVGPPLYMGG